MKKCSNCGYTGTDTENYCNRCGSLMNTVSNSMQSSFYDTSSIYQASTSRVYEEPPKKKTRPSAPIYNGGATPPPPSTGASFNAYDNQQSAKLF